MWQRLADRITLHLGNPGRGPIGWYVRRQLRSQNEFLERSAVELCDIKPHHNVLEVGFGSGIGLKCAFEKLQDGSGKLYGIDRSQAMVDEAAKTFRREIADGKVELVLSAVEDHPFSDNTFDRVFHSNCYYFWPDPTVQSAQIYRAMKPESLMVTTLNLQRIQQVKDRGVLLTNANTDPDNYMKCLQAVGFERVEMHHLTDSQTEKSFQAIFAYVTKSPHANEK